MIKEQSKNTNEASKCNTSVWDTVQYKSHKILLLYQSQSYNWLRVFYLCILNQFIGIHHVRLGSFTVKVEWIVKCGLGLSRLLVEEECGSR